MDEASCAFSPPSGSSAQTESSRLAFEPEMVLVPAGSFLMGTRPEELDDLFVLMEKEKKGMPYEQRLREAPQFEMYLPAYGIGRYPVTNAEYAVFIADTDYEPPVHWNGKEVPEELADHPVVNVTWLDAVACSEWLSKRTGKHYRLPTEAEWDKAARGADGRRYPWGNDWNPELCNNAETGPKTTTPVGQFSPDGDSPYGCADMIGNVWEWCSSRYGGTEVTPSFKYPYDPKDGREDMVVDDSRILRGGSFFNGRGRARCEYRGRGAMTHRNDHTGFRVARNIYA
jgi:formylglycine-generating enzyme required for sulfatase activity